MNILLATSLLALLLLTIVLAPGVSSFQVSVSRAPSVTRLFAGGFGGSGDASKKKKKSPAINKAKPKQQWDRFLNMKTQPKIPVAVRVVGEEEWLKVGHVRSEIESGGINLALARQRAIIADHASRLYPLQVSARQKVDWAYQMEEDGEWTELDKSALDGKDVDNLDKKIGFAGTADPASGYYCVYDGGKVTAGGKTK